MAKTVSFQQILAPTWATPTGTTYSLFGLGNNGKLYKWNPKDANWTEYSDKVAEEKLEYNYE